MSPYVIIIMLALVMLMTYRNMKVMSRYRHNKDYITCYQEMLENKPETYEHIKSYMDSETSEEYINKARILKIYYELDDNAYQNELNELNFHDWYYTKEKVDKEKLSYNSDSIIWIILLMAKANKLSEQDVNDEIIKKMNNEKDATENYVEYKLIENTYKLFKEGKEADVSFLNDLIVGEYEGLQYDKQLIGMYKRIAEALLAYKGEELEEYYQEDLNNFSKNLIGSALLKNLEIYDSLNKENEDIINNEVEEDKVEQ